MLDYIFDTPLHVECTDAIFSDSTIKIKQQRQLGLVYNHWKGWGQMHVSELLLCHNSLHTRTDPTPQSVSLPACWRLSAAAAGLSLLRSVAVGHCIRKQDFGHTPTFDKNDHNHFATIQKPYVHHNIKVAKISPPPLPPLGEMQGIRFPQ